MTTPDDTAAIDRMLARLRGLRGLAQTATPDIAVAVKKEIVRNVGAQEDPYHHAWKPGQEGKPILTNAASHVTVDSSGTVVQISLNNEIDVRHHRGSARGYKGGAESGRMPKAPKANWKRKWFGGFRRTIIPPGGTIPGPMRTVIAKELERNFEKLKK
jgi:hypothetical protein